MTVRPQGRLRKEVAGVMEEIPIPPTMVLAWSTAAGQSQRRVRAVIARDSLCSVTRVSGRGAWWLMPPALLLPALGWQTPQPILLPQLVQVSSLWLGWMATQVKATLRLLAGGRAWRAPGA